MILGLLLAGVHAYHVDSVVNWGRFKIEVVPLLVVFPPDKDVMIERRYTASNGDNVMGSTTFSYTTHTGAVWKDSIGKAEFTVKLDGWTVDDLAFEDGVQKNRPRDRYSTWCSPNRAERTVVSPTELKMTWKDFEPAVHKTRRGIHLATWSTRRWAERWRMIHTRKPTDTRPPTP